MSIHDTAFPYVNRLVQDREDNDNQYGMSKIEYATIKMVPVVTQWTPHLTPEQAVEEAYQLARIVLNRANR